MGSFQLNIFELLILFGIFQALVLVLILLFKKENQTSNIFLAIFILALAYSSGIFLNIKKFGTS